MGEVIDAGCGTGENAIFFASKGHRVLGIDSAPLAIEKARAKARRTSSGAEFMVASALNLGSIGRKFDSAVDSGLFHVFGDAERQTYVQSISSVLRSGGRFFVLCFSDSEPSDWGGPRRISKPEILDSFSIGWRVEYVRPAIFESTFHEHGGRAWLSRMTKTK